MAPGENDPTSPSEGCPLEPALRRLAGSWTLRILWFLHQAPRGFADLQRDLVHVSPKVMSERLKQMEARGIISRTCLDDQKRFVQYALTPPGHEFRQVLESMCTVARKMPQAQATPAGVSFGA